MAKQPKKITGVYQKYEDGDWYVQYRLSPEPVGPGEKKKPGKLIRKMIGTRQQAIDYLSKVRHIRASGDGILPTTATQPARTAAEARTDMEGVVFGDLCDGLLKQIQKNPTEYKDQKNPPQRIAFIKEAFGHRQAASIEPYEIAEWIDTALHGLAPATKNRYKAVFSAIFTFGKAGKHKLKVNPARDVKQKKVNNGVIRFLLPAEENRLRAVLQKDVDACGPRNEQLRKHMLHRIYEFDVAIGTGMRKGEQYNLTWPDIDFQRREITARDTKNGDTRIIPMIDDVYVALKALQALGLTRKRRSRDKPNLSPADAVFAIGDNKNWWANALKAAKITNYRWHDNRHTFCSRLAQSTAASARSQAQETRQPRVRAGASPAGDPRPR
jgi:integrase